MADLSDIQSAQAVKVVGSDSSGVEQTPVQSTANGGLHTNLRDNAGTELGTTANPVASKLSDGTDVAAITTPGDLAVTDGIRSDGVFGNVSVPTANTAVEVKVGAGRLTSRKLVTVLPDADMWWGYSIAVTSSNGTPIYKNQMASWSTLDDTAQIWVVCASSSKNIRVTEAT